MEINQNQEDQISKGSVISPNNLSKVNKRFGLIGLVAITGIILILTVIAPILKDLKPNKEENDQQTKLSPSIEKEIPKDSLKTEYPTCPTDLTGILTYPIVELEYVRSIRPLGDVNPPGHTSPVDHATFMTDFTGKIPIYAPADGWITRVEDVSELINGEYQHVTYRIYQTICEGLEISAAGYDEITFVNDLPDNPNCRQGIAKPGYTSGTCDYRMNKLVKAGELLGYTQLNEIGVIPFEWWATNQNQARQAGVNWDYYKTDDSGHAMCLFDLYGGELRTNYYNLFGQFDPHFENMLDPRTIEPLCGEINQDKVGTIQGMWFGGGPDENSEFAGKAIAFLHNAFNGTQVMLSIGGNITNNTPTMVWINPKSSGTIDRDPGDITADGKVYCYDLNNAANIIPITGKILVQLIDNNHVGAEHQSGSCGTNEVLVNPYQFQR